MTPIPQTTASAITVTAKPAIPIIESLTLEIIAEETEQSGSNPTPLLVIFTLFGIGLVLVSLSRNRWVFHSFIKETQPHL